MIASESAGGVVGMKIWVTSPTVAGFWICRNSSHLAAKLKAEAEGIDQHNDETVAKIHCGGKVCTRML